MTLFALSEQAEFNRTVPDEVENSENRAPP
jgi:hypothetical protein